MSKGVTISLSIFGGMILYGVLVDWFQEPAQISPVEIEAAEKMCSPASGLQSVGKKGGMRKWLTEPASPVLAVCKDSSTIRLAPLSPSK